jgi:FkbM family methyltransferase
MTQTSLYLKHRLAGTPVEGPLLRARWSLASWHRHRHPELWDLYLEDRRIRITLERLVQRDWMCVDVGAHVGSVLTQLLKLAPLQNHVAFEPSSQKAGWLRARYPTVQVREAAVGEVSGQAVFYEDLDRPGFSGLKRRRDFGDSRVREYSVPLETMDEVLADRKVQFIKLDVEGGELPALRGAISTLETHRPHLLFECGPESSVEPFGYERADLHQFLVHADYDIYSVADFLYGREPMSLPEFRKAGTYPYPGFNYVALAAGSEIKRVL